MRNLLLTASLIFVSSTSICQMGKAHIFQRELDSLRQLLPSVKGTHRVDVLNMISDRFHYLPMPSLQHEYDSAWPYAVEAHAEAKKLNYKKGIAYSLVRLGDCEDTKDNMGGNEPAYRQALKDYNEAIAIGKEINNSHIIAYSHSMLSWLEEKRDNIGLFSDYMKKAIHYFELSGNEMTGTYEESDLAKCAGCKGNEIWLGKAYHNFGRGLTGVPNKNDSIKLLFKKAIGYYDKAGDKAGEANAYFWYRRFQAAERDLEGAVESTRRILTICQELGKEEDVLREYNWLCNHYGITGNFEVGTEYAKKSIQLAEELAKRRPIDSVGSWYRMARGQAFLLMGRFYQFAGDYESALDYLHKAKVYYTTDSALFDSRTTPGFLDTWDMTMGEIHRLMGNYDSAKYYLVPFETKPDRNSVYVGRANLSKLYIDMKQYDKALALLNKDFEFHKKGMGSGMGLSMAATAYMAKKDYSTALKYARMDLTSLRLSQIKVKMIDSYHLMSEIFTSLKRFDSAHYYLRQYTVLKDSLLNRQFLWKLNSYKKEAEEERKTSQINLLNKDNQIKNQQLKQQALLKNFLFGGLLALLLITIFIYRNLTLKRKNETLKAEQIQSQLQQKATDLEMQALRAQMNPHFIFNCLSSINRFILKNETETASDYLTRFSRLIRMVLINSQKTLISLEDEVEMLKLYLDMERLRFKKSFDYNITFSNTVDTGSTQLPPLLLQPFCENAIWHGLMHKEGQGRLDITLSMESNILNCIITDNGIGRQKAAELKSRSGEERKSLGLKITTERLALLNHEKGPHTFYEIEDLKDENGASTGTKVILKISSKEPIQETV